MMTKTTKLAVIDIGTLKVKFLLANKSPSGEITPQYSSNILTCLGVRMSENNNKPWPKYLKDTIGELKRCKEILANEKVDRLRVVSTHALREMGKVGKDIAGKIKKEVGLNVEIISQEEEANLFFSAVLRDFKTDQDFTVVDVGGGSVQVLIGTNKKLKQTYLLKTGAQYLFDTFSPRHTGADFPTREEIQKMQDYIMQQLIPIPQKIGTPVIYGSSCIIDVFKTIGIKLNKFKYSKSHPYYTKVAEMEKFMNKITPVPYDKRERMFNFYQKYYMWGIEKAFLNIINICKKENSSQIIPSNANINEGLILSLTK
jgi:exopolyphosphatase / guanosine-5'-triphosphate,3'-diphosphate pyrophosphatase